MAAKQMHWRKKDALKLSRSVQKFNSSITKLSNKHPELADAGLFPQKLDISQIKERGLSRRDYNRLLKRIDRWFKPKNREIIMRNGIRMTRYEYNEARYDVMSIQYRSKQKSNLAGRSIRQQQKIKPSEQFDVESKLSSLKDRIHSDSLSDFTPEDALEAWKMFTQTVFIKSGEYYYQKGFDLYYKNYEKAVRENFPSDYADQIMGILSDLGIDGYKLYTMVGEYPPLDIDYLYGPEEVEAKIEQLIGMIPYVYNKLFK